MKPAAPARTRMPYDVVFVHGLDLPETVGSYRCMSIIPAQEIGARFLRLPPEESPDEFLDRIGGEVLVFGKPIGDARVIDVAERARARGVKVISWQCDLRPADEPQLRRQANASDAIVVQTVTMADMVARSIGRRPDLIEECLEYPPNGHAHFEHARDPLQLLWYGHANNFDTLGPMLASLEGGVGRRLSLLLMANGAPPPALAARLQGPAGRPLEMAFTPWSRALQLSAMRSCDIVLTPSLDAQAKYVKGHNRVSEALNQGCIVVAYPLPQYEEFADYVFLDRDMAAGVRRALADPDAALARARAGMAAVRTRFAPNVLAEKWLALIARVAQT
jgi:glycosyltransferase involved in cell wall biosynthesis